MILLAGFTVSILLMRFLASGVTVSHSGEGYWKPKDYNVNIATLRGTCTMADDVSTELGTLCGVLWLM